MDKRHFMKMKNDYLRPETSIKMCKDCGKDTTAPFTDLCNECMK